MRPIYHVLYVSDKYMHFLVSFLGSVMLPYPQATSTEHGKPQKAFPSSNSKNGFNP